MQTDQNKTVSLLSRTVKGLSEISDKEMELFVDRQYDLPSVADIQEIISLLRQLLFPELYRQQRTSTTIRKFHIGVGIERLYDLLRKEIPACLSFYPNACADRECLDDIGVKKSAEVIEGLPDLKRKLYTDIEAIFGNDPAVGSEAEIIFCYPGIKAMMNYRFAHLLQRLEIPLLPRIISELAHSETGIDIHPGAQIGEYLSIDHGTGIVIGETCVIGNHVTIYQGVTLGAKSFTYDGNGHPLNVARHPIIEDNVTIYSNASVLGRITIGHDSVIGGNVWVTSDVAPFSRIVQGQTRNETFTDGAGI